jgi:transcriptional regulator with XRE-family HTH domain
MTQVKAQKDSFANFASQMARNPDTLAHFTELMAQTTRKKETGERIADLRENRKHLTVAQMCERIGIGTSTGATRKYQYWEEGKHSPPAETLEAIADVLGVSYDFLVTGGDQPPPSKDILKRLDEIQNQQAELASILSEVRSDQERLLRHQGLSVRDSAKKNK